MSGVCKFRCGFSLVELLAAIAVGGLLLLVCLTVLNDVAERHMRLKDALELDRAASLVMRQLTRDLSSAAMDPAPEFEASSSEWARDRIGFHGLMPATSQSPDQWVGDLCAVVYRVEDVRWGGVSTPCLMRVQQDSDDVHQRLCRGRSLLSRELAALDGPLASGVVAFEARPVVRGDGGGWVAWDERAPRLPRAVEVRLVLAGRRLVDRLQLAVGGGDLRVLGDPSMASAHPDLRVYCKTIRLGPG